MAMKKEALTNLIADDLAKRNDNWAEIDTTFGLKANKQQEAWITPTLLNGWTGDLKYRKNEFGNLEIIGDVTSPPSTTNGVIFSLPIAYRFNTSFITRFIVCAVNTPFNTGIFRFIYANNPNDFMLARGDVNTRYAINISIPVPWVV